MVILITGSSGAIGRRIVEQLLTQGHSVHTLTRKPLVKNLAGVRGFCGDLTAQSFDAELFKGVQKLFLFPAQGKVDAFLNAAKANGVEHVVVLSSLAAAREFPRDQESPSALHHAVIENSAINSKLKFTIIRPGSFANNLRQWSPTIKTQGMVFGPYPESAQALIHEYDIADLAVVALTNPGHEGKTYPLTGPAALSQLEQLDAIANAIGKELKYQKISPEQFRESMLRFVPEGIVKMLLDYWSDTEKSPDKVKNTFAEITGKPARTLQQWALDHAADFR